MPMPRLHAQIPAIVSRDDLPDNRQSVIPFEPAMRIAGGM